MTKSKDMANPIILDLGLFLWTFGSGNHAPVRPDVTIHFFCFFGLDCTLCIIRGASNSRQKLFTINARPQCLTLLQAQMSSFL